MSDRTKEDQGSAGMPEGAKSSAPQPSPARQKTEADRRREREAAKLRENLQRRKQQLRARRAGHADETEGLPAAKMDES